MQNFIKIPFCATGTKTTVPVPSQLDGSVNFTDGYGPDYQLDPGTDPAALNIERDKFNWMLYTLSAAIQSYQQHGIPDFITTSDNGGTPFTYSKYAVVMYDPGTGSAPYQSLIDTNTDLPTVATSWASFTAFVLANNIATTAQAQAGTNDTVIMTPLKVSQAVPAATTVTQGRIQLATQLEVNAGTVANKAVTPATLAGAITSARATVRFNAQTMTVINGFNVASISKLATGRYRITFTNAVANPIPVPGVLQSSTVGGYGRGNGQNYLCGYQNAGSTFVDVYVKYSALDNNGIGQIDWIDTTDVSLIVF